MNTNSLFVLFPYKYEGAWVFDDATVGLVREPFVFGIDRMIDELTRDIPSAPQGFKLIFSASPFPGHAAKLEWNREECGGNWYHSPTFGYEGWLCPALFKYFAQGPREIYALAQAK